MERIMHPADHAARAPDKAAIIMAATGRRVTFAALEAMSNQSAQLLRSLGLARGDIVATLFANAPEVFAFGWAAQRSGLFQTAISNKLSQADIAYILADSGARLLIVSPDFADLAPIAGKGPMTASPTGARPRRRCRRTGSTTKARAPTCSIRRAPPGDPRA
jgi:long-chain acyl-CoA synthetase